jgi:drug/metabolite transporter (DMT)-like permease
MHRFKNWQLLAICVLTWGTTWYAITYQVGRVAPEVGVALRFALAGAVVLALCVMRRERWRFTPAEHGLLALQGSLMYGVAYIFVYHAEKHLFSGLVAVGYSASPLVTGIGARSLFGTRLTWRFVWGGVLGLVGVALIFWPEFGKAAGNRDTPLGALFTVGAVLLSAAGSLTASRNRTHGLPFWPSLGFGMLYGAAVCVLVALWQEQSFVPPAVASWWISLFYLALAGSVLTFACFLTLQERIGPGPTGTVGVMTPLLALTVSMAFEGFHPDVLTFVGAALAVAGNVLMLRRA